MPGFVYILEDDQHRYYIGSSEDIRKRYNAHLKGEVYTSRRMKNVKIALQQEYPTIQIAKKIELKLKKLKRRDYITKIIQDGYIKMKI